MEKIAFEKNYTIIYIIIAIVNTIDVGDVSEMYKRFLIINYY